MASTETSSTSHSILIVEDDAKLAKLMRTFLSEQGFSVTVEAQGDRAIYLIKKQAPDIVILDLMLPKVDGLTICKEVRQYYSGIILMLTASHDSHNEIEGLQMGVDGYLKKPIDPDVLLAHIHSLLKHKTNAVTPLNLEFGALKIDISNQTVYWNNEHVELTNKEYDLLVFLAHHANKPVNRETIMQALKGFDYDNSNRTIDMLIVALRKKFADTGHKAKRIKTIWGKGYLFTSEGW